NLSAVGEQYLDFEPPDDKAPYAEAGDTFRGTDDSLPVDEGDLLVDLDQFVNSVDQDNLKTVVHELGTMFNDTGRPLHRLLANAVSTNQVVVSHLAGIEQLLVTYPRVISAGFTGTPGDGYGHVNLQLDYSVPPCSEGYKPRTDWRPPSDLTDAPIYPAKCT